jgi:hypothetical protein
MKFETLVLRCLFLACLAVCGLVFGAMLTSVPAPGVQLAASSGVSTMLLTTPSSCALPPDGVVCPRVAG